MSKVCGIVVLVLSHSMLMAFDENADSNAKRFLEFSRAHSENGAASGVVDALRKSYVATVQLAKCYATYELVCGFVDDDAKLEDVQEVKGVAIDDGTIGTYAKLGNTWRLSRVTNGSFGVPSAMNDEVHNGEFLLEFIKSSEQGVKHGRTTRLKDIKPDHDGVVRPPNFSLRHPLMPLHAPPDGLPGEFWPLPSSDKFQVSMNKSGQPVFSVSQTVHSQGRDKGHLRKFEIIWNFAESPPTIRSIEISTIDGAETIGSMLLRLLDYRDCGGVMVPAHLVFASKGGLIQGGKNVDSLVLVQHWISKDLGRREPTPDDFRLKIPSGTPILGLKENHSAGDTIVLDPFKIKLDELMMPGDPVFSSKAR